MAVTRIAPEEALKLMQEEGYAYLDVRSVPEFEEGHPKGAYNIPLRHLTAHGMQVNPDFLLQVQASFPKDAKIVVGCKSGGRSMAAAEMLIAAGYTQLREQRAGFSGTMNAMGQPEPGWGPKKLPVANQAEPGHAFAELSQKTRS